MSWLVFIHQLAQLLQDTNSRYKKDRSQAAFGFKHKESKKKTYFISQTIIWTDWWGDNSVFFK